MNRPLRTRATRPGARSRIARLSGRLGALVALGVLALVPLPAGAATSVLLSDDFNRADSTSLGAPWTEINEGATSFIELTSQAMGFHYVKTGSSTPNSRPLAYAPLAAPVSTYPATLSFTFSPHTDERAGHEMGLMTAGSAFTGTVPSQSLAVRLRRTSTTYENSFVEIVRRQAGAATVLATKPLVFQLESGMTYTVAFVINADFSTTVAAGPRRVLGRC